MYNNSYINPTINSAYKLALLHEKKVIINFFNVGHGSCTHIVTPNNKNFLIDVGTNENQSIIEYLKYKLNVNQIDFLIITHPHRDHILDITNLNKLLQLKVLQRSKNAFPLQKAINEQDKILFDYANKINSEYSYPVQEEFDPLNYNYNGGINIKIFDPPYFKQDINDLNTFSPVIVLEFAEMKIVLTGDNNKEILQYSIEQDREFVRAISNSFILLAPHHGRDTDFCKDFFDIVNPYLTIVSDKKIAHDSQITTATNYKNDKHLNINGLKIGLFSFLAWFNSKLSLDIAQVFSLNIHFKIHIKS